ncbi:MULTISPECIES: alanine/glycine:cation symporter family protein [unclassified Aminobacterium]|uniref:alanine/glycine:cation symporter family protein n=1 Tax=unclassified Aminobacterium TaxID=2685012 RepID=UPI00257F5BCA|nr:MULTISPECIES: sodium:alanine symporter family protein [unclassified Aminobacterium]
MRFCNWFAGVLWGWPMMILIFACGLIFSIRTGFFQITHLGYILNNTLGKVFRKETNRGEGVMTPWQAVSTALAGTVGNGNIAGVATAIAMGGPGAIFWMWIVAFFGMMTKMVEVSLAVEYREKDSQGNYYGGPMYYIEKGLGPKWKPLAKFFAAMMVLGALGTAVWVQPHTMGMAMREAFNIPPIWTATVAVLLTALVIIGGFKRIGVFCEKLMPFMCLFYIIASLVIIIANITALPNALVLIFKSAFGPTPAIGGFAGSAILLTMKRGMSRGMFSNEAGMGSAPMVHATAITDHPIRQGLFGAFEVFIDTIVICTMTALVILVAAPNIWHSGLNGVELTFSAFQQFYGKWGTGIVAIGVLLAAFSTMVGYYIEYETSVVYLFGQKAVRFFRWIYLIPPFIAVSLSVEFVWTIVDISTGIEGLPNMLALLLLSGKFVQLFNDYKKGHM